MPMPTQIHVLDQDLGDRLGNKKIQFFVYVSGYDNGL